MGLILDSSVAIAAERRGDSVQTLLQRVIDTTGNQEAALSTAGVIELVHGIHRANTAERRARREAFVEDLLAAVVINPLTTGLTALTALHDLNLAAAYCDRVYMLDAGAIVADGPPEEVLTPSLIASVFSVGATRSTHPVTGRAAFVFHPLPATR